MKNRRRFILEVAGAIALAAAPGAQAREKTPKDERMYGLIGKMRAQPGEREALIAILLEGVSQMPGCLSYVVARDPADADAIWITEVWDSEASHRASLALPAVREAITRAKPLIAKFETSVIVEPVGGHGLAQTE